MKVLLTKAVVMVRVPCGAVLQSVSGLLVILCSIQ